MNNPPFIGERVVKYDVPAHAYKRYRVEVVRDLSDLQKVFAIRAVVYMGEQDCPYDEEFDGNDLCATHMLVFDGDKAIGTLRIRWFAEFAKLERITFPKSMKSVRALHVLLAHAFEVVARKGYRKMLGQIQSRYWKLWSRTFDCALLEDRPNFQFSDFNYQEIEIRIPEHPRAIELDGDPFIVLRPEGDWDRPGILDASSERGAAEKHAA